MLKTILHILLIVLLFLSLPVHAQGRKMSFISDAEIEHYLRELATPVFRAAKLDPNAINLIIIKDSSLNAFVAAGQNIFIHTGLLQATKTPEQLLGVIAHETGHIAGGHLVRGSKAMKNASTQSIIGMIAALAAGLASGRGELIAGGIGGTQSIAQRGLMSYSRAQESAADSAALLFLDHTGQKADGLLQFMETLAGQEYIPHDQRSEYVRTHPFSQDRIANIKHHIKTTPTNTLPIHARFVQMHERMHAKLLGFLRPETALLRYTDIDPRQHARYARAIALYRKSQIDRALPLINQLIKEEPNNAFFHELKGQVLFENGRLEKAASSYKKAVTLYPDSALLRVAYAHALLENGDDSTLDEIIHQLTQANRIKAHNPRAWRFLAAAWSRQGKVKKDKSYQGLVYYALAEESSSLGKDKVAFAYASRAIDNLPKGSPYWLRAQDIRLSSDEMHKD